LGTIQVLVALKTTLGTIWVPVVLKTR